MTDTTFDKQQFKDYLRINFDEDNAVIENLWRGAEEVICTQVSKTATPEKLSKYQMFTIAVRLLATHWYESKTAVPQTATVKANTTEIPYGVTRLIDIIYTRYVNDPEFNEDENSGNEEQDGQEQGRRDI